ncbi:MAG: hypothetical protein KatS3mg061_2307 [Dehalococcoidia bacterium]|nr:MAG: hypothetical protein KatS3mg061_2307 [Dehalococcoidia bacterium]
MVELAFRDQYRRMTRKEILAQEREASPEEVERVRDEIKAWIQHMAPHTAKFLITLRKDGRPHCRPVSAFVEGWTVGTISQGEHLKNQHISQQPSRRLSLGRTLPRTGALAAERLDARGLPDHR